MSGQVPGIPVHAPVGGVEHDLNLYGFFTKTGVSCTDFTAAAVPNPAVQFGAIGVLSHPENGRPGCLVQAQQIEFLKAGTTSFQFTLTERGAHTGTDTVTDTAVVTAGSATQQAQFSVSEAIDEELAAVNALENFTRSRNVRDVQSALTDVRDAESDLAAAHGTLTAADDIAKATSLDRFAAKLVSNAIHFPNQALGTGGFVHRAQAALREADSYKYDANKLLRKSPGK